MKHLYLRISTVAMLAALLIGCGGQEAAEPDTLYLDASSPQSTRASLDSMLEKLGHVESYRLTKVLQDFRERIVVAYSYESAEDPAYPNALWRELEPYDGYSAARLAEELPNATIQGPTVEESAERMRAASVARLERLYGLFTSYASAHDGALPPTVPVEGAQFTGEHVGGLFFEAEAVYPTHLADAHLLVSPAHPQAPALHERLDQALGDEDQAFRKRTIEAVGGMNYLYFGVAVPSEEAGNTFAAALNGEAAAEFTPLRLEGPLAGDIPLLVERPGLQLDGALPVLYADGTVKTRPLGEWPNTVDFQKALFVRMPTGQ